MHQCNNVRATTKHFSNTALYIQPSQKRKWEREEQELREKAKVNPNAGSLHKGRAVGNENLEQEVYDWIVQQEFSRLAVSTTSIVAKALPLDPGFKQADVRKLYH